MSGTSAPKRFFVTLFCIALAIRVTYGCLVPQLPLINDAQNYAALASNLAAGNGYVGTNGMPDTLWPPTYPGFLAVLFSLFGEQLIMVRLAQALLGALTAVLVALVAQRYFGNRVGQIAGWGAALYPGAVLYSGMILTENVYTFLMVLVVWVLHPFTIRRGAIAGGVLGIAALTRTETIALPFVLLGAITLLQRRLGKRELQVIGAMVLIMLAVIVPWTARNYPLYDQFFLINTRGGDTLWISTWQEDWQAWGTFPAALQQQLDGKNPVERDAVFRQAAWENLRSHPGAYAQMSIKRLVRFWVGSHTGAMSGYTESFRQALADGHREVFAVKALLLLINSAVILLGGIGALLLLRTAVVPAIPKAILLSPILFKMGLHTLTFSTSRYHIPIMPFVIICAAYAANHWTSGTAITGRISGRAVRRSSRRRRF